VAIADPTAMSVIDDLKFITRYDIVPVLAGEYSMRAAIEKHYEANEVHMQSLLLDIAAAEEDDVEILEAQEEAQDASVLAAQVDEAPVVKLINAILVDAVHKGASDIHFECFEHELRVRYRIDGALAEVMKPPLKMRAALISRFKIMASLNIAERRVPQDGRIKLKVGRKVIDFRVSVLPTLFGEKVVLRILDKGNLTLDLYAQIGMVVLIGLAAKNGILIVEFANQCQIAGMSKLEAVREAARVRLRPVLMTTIATVAGHFPLILVTGAGAAARNSIGLVLVGGMGIGTIFTLFIVPCLYVLLAKDTAKTRLRAARAEAESAGARPAGA
jgi:hypothetical protein